MEAFPEWTGEQLLASLDPKVAWEQDRLPRVRDAEDQAGVVDGVLRDLRVMDAQDFDPHAVNLQHLSDLKRLAGTVGTLQGRAKGMRVFKAGRLIFCDPCIFGESAVDSIYPHASGIVENCAQGIHVVRMRVRYEPGADTVPARREEFSEAGGISASPSVYDDDLVTAGPQNVAHHLGVSPGRQLP
jgi:hypothetical protein